MKTKKSNKTESVASTYVESAVYVAKNVVSEVNDASFKAAKNLAEGAIERGEQWQGVAEKSIKGGMKLANQQQKIVFDALEAVKTDLTKNKDRFKSLFNWN